MPAPHEATLVFDYPAPESARLVERAVEGELDEIDGDRTRASLVRTGQSIEIRVSADDLVALRAGLNTWSTLVEVAESVGGLS